MEVLKLLQKSLADCRLEEGPNAHQACKVQLAEYEEAADGYQTKCKTAEILAGPDREAWWGLAVWLVG